MMKLMSSNSSATCANGSEVKVIGHMSLPINFKTKLYNIKFLVIPDTTDNFILGMDFIISIRS